MALSKYEIEQLRAVAKRKQEIIASWPPEKQRVYKYKWMVSMVWGNFACTTNHRKTKGFVREVVRQKMLEDGRLLPTDVIEWDYEKEGSDDET